MKMTYYFTMIATMVVRLISVHSLGPNLLVNHDFSIPDILAQGTPFRQFGSKILGWNCSKNCEIINCRLNNEQTAKTHYSNGFSGDCPSQAIDTSSSMTEIISQIFTAKAGEHELSIKFLLPIDYPQRKTLIVLINDEIVLKYRSNSADFNYKETSMKIVLKQDFNKITFTAEGISDVTGFRIFDVKIRRIISVQAMKMIDVLTKNALLSNLLPIPGSRIIFGELINTLISLDRMQLYYYHHRRYSDYYDHFLAGITNLLNQKGTYATCISDAFFSSVGTSEESILKIIDFKQGRKYKDGYNKNNFVQNGGFFFIVSYIPIALIIFFSFHVIFRITSNCKFSKILRKYSFFSLIMLILFEGNIEQFSFLIMDELLEYFSASFMHKAVNIAIAMIFYLIFFCSTAFYLYCWHLHRRNIHYLAENVSLKIQGMMAYTFDRALICLVLGSTHRLTILQGKNQLLILIAVEVLLIIPKIIFLRTPSYKCKKIVWLNITEQFIRILFIISIYIYEDSGILGGMINEEIHLTIIYLFLFVWALNILTIIVKLMEPLFEKRSSECKQKQQKFQNKRIISNCSQSHPTLLGCQYTNKTLQPKRDKFFIKIFGKDLALKIRRPRNA